jgi:S-DNA-T family DNA segregation ATPase FtsK/SpoIIIE
MAATTKRKPTSAKKPPARRKRPPPKRAKRSLMASRPALPDVHLEPHHVDILALALIAIGIFLGGVAYLHWAGGTLGNGAVHGARLIFGALGYAVPAVLVAVGGLILTRELRWSAEDARGRCGRAGCAWWRP